MSSSSSSDSTGEDNEVKINRTQQLQSLRKLGPKKLLENAWDKVTASKEGIDKRLVKLRRLKQLQKSKVKGTAT